MIDSNPGWTDDLADTDGIKFHHLLERLTHIFNLSPFFRHNAMTVRIVQEKLQGYVEMNPHLIGNAGYQILHGGAIATLLDSIGGVTAMSELYRRALLDPDRYAFASTSQQVARLATLDMRVDYLAPGRGQWFVTQAEPLRLGSKSCVMRMDLHNDEHVLIATGIATYSY